MTLGPADKQCFQPLDSRVLMKALPCFFQGMPIDDARFSPGWVCSATASSQFPGLQLSIMMRSLFGVVRGALRLRSLRPDRTGTQSVPKSKVCLAAGMTRPSNTSVTG